MKTYIGIDLGGTNVRVAKVTKDGEILQQLKGPSHATEGPEKVIQHLLSLIRQIEDYEKCAGIGIGVPGPCDTLNGKMTMATNLPGFEHFPFAATISEATGLPTYIDNDANVAGLAEALVGAGKGLPIVYYTTISTGIGGALVVNGSVVSGENGYAGEIANIAVDRNRPKVNHLIAGAVENEASGKALTQKGQVLLGDQIQNAGDVFKMADEGNEQAQQLVRDFIDDLSYMFSAIAHVVDPYVFVIGGGVMQSKEYFFDALQQRFLELVHEGMKQIRFVEAKLDEPGIIGAAMLPVSRGL